jgi:hypothetical protein
MDLTITAVPPLSKVQVDEISGRIFSANNGLLPCVRIPGHTQAAMRDVKLAMKASEVVCKEIILKIACNFQTDLSS